MILGAPFRTDEFPIACPCSPPSQEPGMHPIEFAADLLPASIRLARMGTL
jgi:hypothetical protein